MKRNSVLIFISIIILMLSLGTAAFAQEDEAMTEKGFVKARLVSINSANSYTLILNGQEIVVALMGADFENANFYTFDNKHYQYVEWLLEGYQYIWVDYDPDRTTEKGTPLVYFYYGPWETELWEQSANVGDAHTQSKDHQPPKVNFWGKPLEVYDHNTVEPFIDDPQFSTVDNNWAPNYNPKEFGTKEHTDEKGRKWNLREINVLMLRSGFAEVDMDLDFERKEEFKNHMNVAKWCRRGIWKILLVPNREAEEKCGVKSLN
ncbi:MAG: hypothetical protein ACOCUI_05960 [bacterium]